MRRILCFGDSNTYGYDPVAVGRFLEQDRWPLVLGRLLGDGYHVVEEGLNGRTTIWESDIDVGRSAEKYLFPCLQSHQPLDLVIIMLGTNDCKERFSRNPKKIAQGLERLVAIWENPETWYEGIKPAELLIIAPILITSDINNHSEMLEEFGQQAIKISEELPALYKAVAEKHGAHYLYAEDYASASQLDGIHFEKAAASNLAAAIAERIPSILG